MNPYIVMMAASTAISIYGNWKAQQDKEEAARQQHAQAVAQTAEIKRRLDINSSIVVKQEQQTKGAIEAQIGASGMGMSTSMMDRLTDVAISAEQERKRMHDEAFYQTDMVMAGANINLDMVRKGSTALAYGSLASLADLGYKSYDYYDRKSEDTSLLTPVKKTA